MSTLLQIECIVPDGLVNDVNFYLTIRAPQGWQEKLLHDEEAVLFTIYFEDADMALTCLKGLSERWSELRIKRESIEAQDWGAAWREFFTPVEAADFVVLPPWRRQEASDKHIPIVIEPKTAFGTGHHSTTALCLEAISDLVEEGTIARDARFFDLGTGSGVLGIGACKLGLTGLGSDIDPVAIENAIENAEHNNVAEAFTLKTGSVEAADGAAFDLVIANILANPLKELSEHIVNSVKTGGSLILSGLLKEQLDGVASVYVNLGLAEPERRTKNEWGALVWRKIAR
ncbi:50S ribosomal protein L11 methyltransferase [Desulfobaculum bizertense]|uniref:50S ribosomal protein L11 methyltransferase n=1 Tax=Desulfobaculum bizertense TaxID=376490 RepID=UPI001F47E6CE|nr:50S ribosomal protein L11 methyltransferase [Desulfobaculum bizertense]UIJ39141.1 50S ribosomal protein L11 methyltransferase [Desulfobaculum bizertense]